MLTIPQIKNAIAQIAPEYPVKQVQLFGSYADGLATEKSDVDILVEFSEWPISLWDYCGFQQAIADALDTKVDLLRFPLSQEASSYMEIQKTVNLWLK